MSMVIKENLLKISSENIAESEFMSTNFIDKEIKNRAFINTLGAEVLIQYLSENGVNTQNLRNMHSIKRVLEKINIADIILPNIHIDVRVVFEDDKIFIPKSHFDFGIVPNVYAVLKFNNNYENIDFIGYFEPDAVDEDKCNDEYYFVNKAKLIPADGFVDYVKNFLGNTEQNLSDSEFLKGRELSVLASDEDATGEEFKKYLQMLKTSSALRDAVLEYDNFETLSGSVANYMHERNENTDQDDNDDETEEAELIPTEDLNSELLTQEIDPNGDELIDDDNFAMEDNLSSEISDSSVSDEAIELAGMSGDINDNDLPDIDSGLGDFDISLDSVQQEESENSLEALDFADSNISSEIDNLNNENNSEDFSQGDNLDGFSAEFDNLDLSQEDLTDFDLSNESMDIDAGLQEIPTEEIANEIDDLSVNSGENILDTDAEIPEEDMLSMTGDIDIQNTDIELDASDLNMDAVDDINNDTEDSGNKEISDLTKFESDNVSISSYEHFNPEEGGSIDVGLSKTNNENSEAVDFTDIEYEEGLPNFGIDNSQDDNNLYDMNSFAEITENPFDDDEIEDNSNFDDLNIEQMGEFITEAPEPQIVEDSVEPEDSADISSNVIENSTIISDKDFEPGEILLDINKTSLPDFGDDGMDDIYTNEPPQDENVLNNDVRIAKKGVRAGSINNGSGTSSSKKGVLGIFLILAVAGTILFSVMKMMNPVKEDPNAISGSLNPENKVSDNNQDNININPDNVVMNDNNGRVAPTPGQRALQNNPSGLQQNDNTAQTQPAKPIPPTAFLSVKKLSWEVPDYVSYNAEFRQFFQSSGRSLKTALSSDLLLATDYAYSNVIKLSITFDKTGKFKDAKIVSSSGSSDVDRIVLQSVNQTLNLLKAPNSVANDENTTAILKIYL